MEQSRFHHTSIFSVHLERLHDPAVDSIKDFALYDHPAIEAIKQVAPPICKVVLTRLEPRVRVYSDESLRNTLQCSEDVTECILTETYLYDTRHLGQLMCIGVGRYEHNLLRPFVGDRIDEYYEHPELYDPESLCAQISRDHGLVFLDPRGGVAFRDFGTKKEGSRKGSKNGTWVNGNEPIQGLVIPWRPEDFLGIGGRVWVKKGEETLKEHFFKLRYEYLSPNEPGFIRPASN